MEKYIKFIDGEPKKLNIGTSVGGMYMFQYKNVEYYFEPKINIHFIAYDIINKFKPATLIHQIEYDRMYFSLIISPNIDVVKTIYYRNRILIKNNFIWKMINGK